MGGPPILRTLSLVTPATYYGSRDEFTHGRCLFQDGQGDLLLPLVRESPVRQRIRRLPGVPSRRAAFLRVVLSGRVRREGFPAGAAQIVDEIESASPGGADARNHPD